MTDLERALEIVEAAAAEWATNSGGAPAYPLPAKNIIMREHIARAIAAERKRCALVCKRFASRFSGDTPKTDGMIAASIGLAAAIRNQP